MLLRNEAHETPWQSSFFSLSLRLCKRSHCDSLRSYSVTHQGRNTGHSSNAFHLHRQEASCFSIDKLISMNSNMRLAQTKMWCMLVCMETHVHHCTTALIHLGLLGTLYSHSRGVVGGVGWGGTHFQHSFYTTLLPNTLFFEAARLNEFSNLRRFPYHRETQPQLIGTTYI